MEKEEAFIKEYEALLKKYNVELHLYKWGDEWGNHLDISFKESGRYCNINYIPKIERHDDGYRGMGT